MELWQNESGWDYYCGELDTEITNFPAFQAFHSLWQGKRTDKFLPAWEDFSFEEFNGWHKHIIYYQILHDPFDLYYRIFGSFPTDVYGTNCTGHKMRGRGREIEDECDINHFEKLYNEKKIGASKGAVYWRDREHVHLSVLDLPLSSDGNNITHFLTCILENPEKRTNHQEFGKDTRF